MNKVILMGNITQNPEIKFTPNGTKVISIGIATNESYKNSNGEKIDKAEFHNLVAWDKKAEFFENYVTKGMKLLIEWKLQTKNWEDDTGTKRYKTEIIVNLIEFCEKKKDDLEQRSSQKKNQNSEISIEDIPF